MDFYMPSFWDMSKKNMEKACKTFNIHQSGRRCVISFGYIALEHMRP